MLWFKQPPKGHPEKVHVLQLRFCGEQDGLSERQLKERLVQFFQGDQSVRSAYLATVVYGDHSPVNVALCVRTQFGADQGLAEKIGRIFASMFGRREHLDIIFLDHEQEADLAKVCSMFFG